MSFDVSWDIDKYREDHESDEHWQLRRNFIERWKDSYPEERLICLARVFANMEFMGCRYPQEVMQEVARMSKEVNSEVTYNNFANISTFAGHSIAQNTGPATPYAIEQLDSNYSDKIQDSSQNKYVWSPYSEEGPGSVCKDLRTEQMQNFIRENTPSSELGLAKFPGMDPSQSSLAGLTNSRLDTLKPHLEPRNALITYQNASDPELYRFGKPNTINNSNTQDKPSVPQNSGIDDTNWQSGQKPTQAYNILDSCPVSNAGSINYVGMISAHNEKSLQQCNNNNYNSGQQNQILTRFDGNHTSDYPGKNDWRQTENNSTGLINPLNQFYRSNIDSVGNINASPSNISAGISNIGTTNIDYAAANNEAYSNDVGAGVKSNKDPVGNDTKVICNTVPVKQSATNIGVGKRPKEKRKRLVGKRKIKYKYWLSAGKSKKEAEALATIRLSRIPEYKVIKKTLGSVKSFHKNKNITYQSKTVYDNGYYGNIKLNNMNNPAKRNDNDPINQTDNVCNTATVSNTPNMSKPVTTSNNPIGVSNTLAVSNCNYNLVERSHAIARNNTASSSNNAMDISNTGYRVSANSQIAENLHNVLDTTSTMKVDSPKSQKDLWLEQNKNNPELISQIQLPDNTLVKQLKAKTKTTMIKLAQKDKFRQLIPNIKDSNPQSLKIEMNASVIEILDDEDTKNKANESFEKEMKEKRRIWWLQQGKKEDEANFLSQQNMAIEDALEIMPNHDVLNKYLQDQNLPSVVVKETQNVLKHEHLNTSGNISDSMLCGNIENNENEQLNNIINDFYSQNMESNKCITETETTAKYKIPKEVNTEYVKNTTHAKKMAPLTTNPDFTVILPKGTINIPTTYKIYVKDAKKEICSKQLLQLQNVIAQCISDHNQVKFLRVNRLNGCAVVICQDENFRDWLDKEIPSLVPWEGAELIVLNEADIPVFIYAWIYVPVVPEVTSFLNPEELLIKLHEQNDTVGCDEWKVLSSQFMGEGQLCLVRFESKSAIVLHSMDYKLKWFGEQPIKVKVKQKNQETLKKVIKKNVKPAHHKKKNINPFNQNKTMLSRRNKKKAKSCHTNTENILSNQKVNKLTPVVTIVDDDGKIQHKENKYVDKTAEDMPQVSRSEIGNKDLNDIEMSSYKPMMGHYNQGVHPQLTSYASEISYRHDLITSTSISANQNFPTDQAKLVPLDALPPAENRSVYESLTDQTKRGDLGLNNESTVAQSSSERSRVKATANANYWSIDSPRLLPGHRQALKFKTDLWDYDSRERKNSIKKVNFARQNYDNVEDCDFRNIFKGDEEYSLEERVFAGRKTRKDQGQGILKESRMLRRDGEHSLSNRNYDETCRVFHSDEDITEQGRGYLYNEDESSHTYSQEDCIGKAQPYYNNEITTNLDKDSRSYSKEDNSYVRNNSQQDYVIDKKDDQMQSWKNTDVDMRYQENRSGRYWIEDRQGYSYDKKDLDYCGPGYSQEDTQSKSYGTYSGQESRQREQLSAGRDYRENSRKGKVIHKEHEYFKIGHHQREMKDERSRSANSRKFLLEDRVDTGRNDSRMEPGYSGHYQDSRTDVNVGVLRALVPKTKRTGAYRKALKKRNKYVANDYRDSKKHKLQRTFVSASDAAEDRARGVKREGGVLLDEPKRKTNKIEFVKPGQVEDVKSDYENTNAHSNIPDTKSEVGENRNTKSEVVDNSEGLEITERPEIERIDYMAELSQVKCLDVRRFRNNMFGTRFGKLVLMVRSWAGKLWNIQSSCQVCGMNLEHSYDNESGRYSLSINGVHLAEAKGTTKQLAKKVVGDLAWNIMKEEVVMLLVKEQFIAHNEARISVRDVSGAGPGPARHGDEFGATVETSVASKMMKMMGWKGGGLGADSQGIAEPIKPHLQIVNRAGLGSMSSDVRQLKRAVDSLMRRYISSDCLDVDLVFSSDFSKEERAALHQVAKNAHLVSRSYGQGDDRFLVVRKKLDPFSLVQAVIEKGGNTPKYQVFIPSALDNKPSRR